MIILGVDPGTTCTGYGVITCVKNIVTKVASGHISLPVTQPVNFRLEIIYDELNKIIKLYKPEEFAIETAFYGKNVQSAMKIGYARGVSILAAMHNKIEVREYSPREIKKSVAGNGSATKEQVQYMVTALLELRDEKMRLDESDALAAALCHAFRLGAPVSRTKSWKTFIEANPERVINNN